MKEGWFDASGWELDEGRSGRTRWFPAKKVVVGTELNIVQEGVPDAIPVEACYLGWQESLENLKRLVEPDIKP